MPSIERRGKRSFRLIVEDESVGGKRVQRKKTIRITDDALLKTTKKLNDYLNTELAKFKMEVESGEYIKPQRMTFQDFIPVWKKNFADVKLGEYTRKNYMDIITGRLIPEFGNMPMNKITTMRIVSFLASLRSQEGRKTGSDRPLSTNYVLNIYKVLKSIFAAATTWKVISKDPMLGVERPSPSKAEKKAIKSRKNTYSLEEARQVILALYEEPERWRLYFIGALLGGFRRGEMLAVEWPQVDFTACGIHICKQITLSETGAAKEGELKTEESEAFVPMPRWYMDALKEYKERWEAEKASLGGKWKGGDKQYLFHGGTGLCFYPKTPTSTWNKFLKKHNLPHIRLHDLRHTTATLLRDDGVDAKSIQERLRHTRLSTTADIYMHKTISVSRTTADHLEKLDPHNECSQSVPNIPNKIYRLKRRLK